MWKSSALRGFQVAFPGFGALVLGYLTNLNPKPLSLQAKGLQRFGI